KLSRRLAKDPVTSPIRAPFTRATGVSGPAELAEEVQGGGLRRAVGELLTCPFCLDQWVATAFVCGLTVAPRATRLVAATFTSAAPATTVAAPTSTTALPSTGSGLAASGAGRVVAGRSAMPNTGPPPLALPGGALLALALAARRTSRRARA